MSKSYPESTCFYSSRKHQGNSRQRLPKVSVRIMREIWITSRINFKLLCSLSICLFIWALRAHTQTCGNHRGQKVDPQAGLADSGKLPGMGWELNSSFGNTGCAPKHCSISPALSRCILHGSRAVWQVGKVLPQPWSHESSLHSDLSLPLALKSLILHEGEHRHL